jgi:hypothetical protein
MAAARDTRYRPEPRTQKRRADCEQSGGDGDGDGLIGKGW